MRRSIVLSLNSPIPRLISTGRKVIPVHVAYPIWWDQAPRVVNTFIESNDLSGKTIVTFCTSGETSIDGSVRQLKAEYPALDFVKGKRLNGASVSTIEKWISSLKK